ncbi:FAD-dependent oxidoreductase [Brevibacterium daeguense]|uniref:FAD-dependent oxidoreductase n=1 Tax=Brevibacterium daeguense TaxID=909936 RepID=A0ABP8EKE6_9MICO|nr:FAD-dependent oxidoreductase [Brevibacterium daeguense]
MSFSAALAHASTVPFWLDHPARPTPQPALAGERSADLAIVGAGFTGLWTALLAKEADPDRRVVILEGGTVGWAASGRNGGFCEASLTHGTANGARHLPEENDRLVDLGRENLDAIEATVRKRGLDCEFERTGVITVATETYQAAELAAEHAPDEGLLWLDRDEVAEHIRSPLFLGGLWDRESAALVHPAKLCWELLRVVRELGVEVHEDSVVRRLRSSRDGKMELRTDGGSVTASRVALATNAFPALLPRVRWHTVPVYDYALVTEPLTAPQREALGWRNRQGLAGSANRFHYFRLTADDRILWGGWDAIYHFGRRVSGRYDQRPETFATLARQFFDTFPQLQGLRFTHKWGGAIDTCSRFFPFFDRADDGRVAYTAGFTGLGVGASRFAARVMLDLLSGQETELTRLKMVRSKPIPFPPEPLAWAGISLTTRALARADENEGRRGPLLKTLDAWGMGFDS